MVFICLYILRSSQYVLYTHPVLYCIFSSKIVTGSKLFYLHWDFAFIDIFICCTVRYGFVQFTQTDWGIICNILSLFFSFYFFGSCLSYKALSTVNTMLDWLPCAVVAPTIIFSNFCIFKTLRKDFLLEHYLIEWHCRSTFFSVCHCLKIVGSDPQIGHC